MSSTIARVQATDAPQTTAATRPPQAGDAPAAPSAHGDTISTGSPSLGGLDHAATLVAAKPTNDVASMSAADKIQTTIRNGTSIAAGHAVGALKQTLSDPKTVALIAGGTAAAIGVQFVPVAGEAVDVVAGVAGVAMYAAAGPEHKARIGQAVGELKAYLGDVSTAKTQADLDRASGHFAKFLELGGNEAVDGMATLAGAVAAPARFASLATKVRELGGLANVGRLAESGGAAWNALASGARGFASDVAGLASKGWEAVSGGVSAAERRLADVFGLRAPELATAGAGAARASRVETDGTMMMARASKTGGGIPRYDMQWDEARGGHTLAKHVGKDEAFLRSRLRQEPNIRSASSFYSEANANKSVGQFIDRYRSDIAKWLADPSRKERFSRIIDTGSPQGVVLKRGANATVPSSKVDVVLAKDDSARGFHVLTSYPTP